MFARVYQAIRNQWMGALALFLVLTGGTAYGLAGSNTVFSDDIVNGEVKNPDLADNSVGSTKIIDGKVFTPDLGANAVTTGKIADGQVRNPDLAPSSVATGKVADNNLQGADIANGSLGGTDIADDNLTGLDIGDETLGGADIEESTLGLVPRALLGGLGRSASPGGECDPDEQSFITCAFTTINLPTSTRVLVIGTIKAQTEPGGSNSTGQCRLATNFGSISGSLSGFDAGAGQNAQFVPLIATTFVGPGQVDFGIECNEINLDLEYFDARVAAVALAPS